LQVAISLKCSIDTSINRKKFWLAAHQYLFELTLPLNLLTSGVYWSVLRGPVIENFNGNLLIIFHSYSVHTIPLVASVIILAVTDIVVEARHCVLLVPLCIVYSFFNRKITLESG